MAGTIFDGGKDRGVLHQSVTGYTGTVYQKFHYEGGGSAVTVTVMVTES